MKTIILYTALMLPLIALSQDLFSNSEITINDGLKKEKGKFLKMSDYVIRYADGSPKELYDKIVAWIPKWFNESNYDILNKSKGNYIRFQGRTKKPLKTHIVDGKQKGYDDYQYIIEIRFKYGRFKLEPLSLKTLTIDESLSEGWHERGFMNKTLDHNGDEIPEGKKDAEEQVEFFNELVASLDEYLNEGKIANNDGW